MNDVCQPVLLVDVSQIDRVVEDGVPLGLVVGDAGGGEQHPLHVEVGGANAELADVGVQGVKVEPESKKKMHFNFPRKQYSVLL